MRWKILFVYLLCTMHILTGKNLQSRLEEYASTCGAEVGICVITNDSDTIVINDSDTYPMNSVMKLHQAMAVTNKLRNTGTSPDTVINIAATELLADTYSPMRDRYGTTDRALPLREILQYSLQQSDNNACDILFQHISSINDTEHYIHDLGLTRCSIKVNEDMMHRNIMLADSNHTSPSEAAALINRLYTEQAFDDEWGNFLRQTLRECSTGSNRLPAPLTNTGTTIGHKTGTGFEDNEGRPTGINDVGFITLPDGRHYAVAVFVRRTTVDYAATERIIGQISGIIYEHLNLETE